MIEEQLKDGEILLKIIKTTESELKNLEDFYFEVTTNPIKRDNKVDDGMYNLCISQYKDGSGDIADLSRYGGNVTLLEVIIKELERQIKYYKVEFENL